MTLSENKSTELTSIFQDSLSHTHTHYDNLPLRSDFRFRFMFKRFPLPFPFPFPFSAFVLLPECGLRCLLHLHSLQVRSLAYDLSMRLPVDAFKGTSHDAGTRLGGGYAGLCLGDPDIGELTISEMSPEDIRAELKR